MGISYLFISLIQQFWVNYLFVTSLVAVIFSIVFALTSKENRRLQIPLCCIAIINLPGLFINRYTLLEILGLISFIAGIILTAIGFVQLFKSNKHPIKKAFSLLGSLLILFISGFLNFTAVRPDLSMVFMGKATGPVENLTSAPQGEATLEDGTYLVSNIQYDTQLPNGYLDIYYTPHQENAPTLIFIHGGGYLWGDKATGDPNAKNSSFATSTGARFLAQGYNVVQMNYALAPDYPFPSAIKQVNRGLAFLVSHASELNLDMDRVVIGGGSAGGNLAGTLINIQTNPAYAEAVAESPVISPESIKAAIFVGGLFDNSRFGKTGSVIVDWTFTQLGRAYLGINELATNKEVVMPSNVLDYVTADFPPSFISDGNTGTFTDQAEDMYELLSGYGIPCQLNVFPKEEVVLLHTFEELGSEYSDITFERMFSFLANVMK